MVTAIAIIVAAVASLIGTAIKNKNKNRMAEEANRLEALEKLPDWIRPVDLLEKDEDNKVSLIIIAGSLIILLLLLAIVYVGSIKNNGK